MIHLNTGAEKGGVCSLRRGRLMSRWVSSKLTSVSDRASPGQAFYHQSSIIRSPSKTHKETDSKAASQTKNRGSKAAPPAAAPRCTLQPSHHGRVVSMISILRTAEVHAVDLAVCVYLHRDFPPFMSVCPVAWEVTLLKCTIVIHLILLHGFQV